MSDTCMQETQKGTELQEYTTPLGHVRKAQALRGPDSPKVNATYTLEPPRGAHKGNSYACVDAFGLCYNRAPRCCIKVPTIHMRSRMSNSRLTQAMLLSSTGASSLSPSSACCPDFALDLSTCNASCNAAHCLCNAPATNFYADFQTKWLMLVYSH